MGTPLSSLTLSLPEPPCSLRWFRSRGALGGTHENLQCVQRREFAGAQTPEGLGRRGLSYRGAIPAYGKGDRLRPAHHQYFPAVNLVLFLAHHCMRGRRAILSSFSFASICANYRRVPFHLRRCLVRSC